jgi:oligosaccharyltransferase complex subunit alpha (ribophorin I)
MDTLGRTSLTLTAINLIDESRNEDLLVRLNLHLFNTWQSLISNGQVRYDYPLSAGLRKPVTIFIGILAVFGTAWVIGRLDTSIGRRV